MSKQNQKLMCVAYAADNQQPTTANYVVPD